jgi:hypothetical protein
VKYCAAAPQGRIDPIAKRLRGLVVEQCLRLERPVEAGSQRLFHRQLATPRWHQPLLYRIPIRERNTQEPATAANGRGKPRRLRGGEEQHRPPGRFLKGFEQRVGRVHVHRLRRLDEHQSRGPTVAERQKLDHRTNAVDHDLLSRRLGRDIEDFRMTAGEEAAAAVASAATEQSACRLGTGHALQESANEQALAHAFRPRHQETRGYLFRADQPDQLVQTALEPGRVRPLPAVSHPLSRGASTFAAPPTHSDQA